MVETNSSAVICYFIFSPPQYILIKFKDPWKSLGSVKMPITIIKATVNHPTSEAGSQ